MKPEIGKTIARNFSIMFGAQIVTWVSSFVLLFFLPRYLGSEDYGRLYLALSIRMMLGLIIDFGGNYLIPKEVARSIETGSSIISTYIILRILLWVLCMATIILLANFIGYSREVNLLILVLVIGKLWEGGGNALKDFFQGIERTEYSSLGLIAERIFVAIFAVIILLMGAHSFGVAIVMTLGALLNLIIVYGFSRKFVTLKPKINFEVFGLLKSGMPYFLFSLFSIIYYRVDAIMLSSMTTETVTGWYGGAYRFFDTVMVFPLIFKAAIFPVFSKLWDQKGGALEETVSKSLKLIIILAVPISLIIFQFSQAIIGFFMGLDEFGSSVILLKIFALSIPIIYVDLIIGSAILGAANRQREWAVTGFLAILINVCCNYIMIPYTQLTYGNGGIGAAIATLITELFMMGSAFYLLPTYYLDHFEPSYIFKPLLAGGIMYAFIFGLQITGIYWMLPMVMGGIIYLIALFVFKTFDTDELNLVKKLISQTRLKMILIGRKA